MIRSLIACISALFAAVIGLPLILVLILTLLLLMGGFVITALFLVVAESISGLLARKTGLY